MTEFRVVLVGCQAQGKTTFFNLICGANEKTQKFGSSCTRQIVQGFSRSGFGFEVIDTPGFNVREDKLTHTAGILAGLSYGNVNRVLIVIKYDRDDYIKTNLEIISKPLWRFNNLFTIILTHWDECKEEHKVEQSLRIQEMFLKTFKINSVLFVSNQDSYHTIIKSLDEIILQNRNYKENEQQIMLLESEIYKYFEFVDMEDESYSQMEYDSEEIQRKFKKIATVYKKFITSLSNLEPYFLDILHALNIKIRDEANKQVEQFEIQHRERILQLEDKNKNKLQYLHYIFLKKALTLEVENVIQKINQKISESNMNVFQYLKQCPNCGLIWLKVAGCSMETTCGNRVLPCDFDDFEGLAVQSKVKIERLENGEIKFEVREPVPIEKIEELYDFILSNLLKDELLNNQFQLTDKEQLQTIISNYLGENFLNQYLSQINDNNKLYFLNWFKTFFQQILTQQHQIVNYDFGNYKQGVGCGFRIVWSELPPLDPQIIQQLNAPDLYDYFADQEELIKKESEWLDKTYKMIISDAVQGQKQNIKKLGKQYFKANQEQQNIQ